ncbi:glycosyltransferase [Halosimplex halophilum]|uniref:glycosyltransferase n=1 Tax=Halosimplex halophilum TaxID=2559572 RepID=UPI00107FCD00|nr:glycosyltransferase [Halosimplex halophilum]
MSLQDKNIAMLYYGEQPHPAHTGFADAIGADFICCNPRSDGSKIDSPLNEFFNGFSLPDYDIYITEGSRPLYSGIAATIFSDSNLIYLGGDHRLRELSLGGFPNQAQTDTRYLRTRSKILQFLCQHFIDGAIAVSADSATFLQQLFGSPSTVRTAKPYVQRDVFKSLSTLSTDLESKKVAVIASANRGNVGDYKGIDMLVDSWPDVRNHFPDLKLEIVGKGHQAKHENTEGVRVKGYVEDLDTVFESIGLYVQPSRLEVFGVSVIESMVAGVPPLVTETTGASSELKGIEPALVVDPNPESIASGIVQYFDRTVAERENIAKECREYAMSFSPDVRTKIFHEEFKSLIDEIQ